MATKKKGETVTFIHYTDEESVQKIKETGKIKPSTDTVKDAVLGKGVYGTSVPPDAGKIAIAENNYGTQIAGHKVEQGKADYAICMEIPASKVTEHTTPDGRHILKHNEEIKLEDYKETIEIVKKK